jgi:hypothetical protein
MGDRYWLGVGARLIAGLAIVAWAASYLTPGSGEKEFKKSLDAMKQAHTLRVAFTATPAENLHNQMLWEIDCNRGVAHYQMHVVNSSNNSPNEMNRDQMIVGNRAYDHQSDGSWAPVKYGYNGGSALGFCTNLAQGVDTNVLPPIATMIRRGILLKGDKKTVNGVRCREWQVTMKGGYRGLEHDTVCLGLEDHLPYEMTVDWENSRWSFSDYNAPLQLDVPQAPVEAASTNN